MRDNRGGSAYYIATIFDLLGRGNVLTIDVEELSTIEHPRVEFLTGSSTDPAIVNVVRDPIEAHKPEHVLVILDSDPRSSMWHARWTSTPIS